MISTIILGMGLPLIGLLSADGDLSGARTARLGSRSTCGALFYLLFRDDVDGDTTCGIGSVCRGCYRRVRDNGNSVRCLQVRTRRFRITLPFVLRPTLLWLSNDGNTPALWIVIGNFSLTLVGTVILAASIAGYIFSKLSLWTRGLLFIAALVLFFAPTTMQFVWVHGIVVLASIPIFYYNWREQGGMS